MKKEGKVPVELVNILQGEGIYIWKETLDGGVVQCGECKNNVLISNHVSKCPLCLAKGEWVDGWMARVCCIGDIKITSKLTFAHS